MFIFVSQILLRNDAKKHKRKKFQAKVSFNGCSRYNIMSVWCIYIRLMVPLTLPRSRWRSTDGLTPLWELLLAQLTLNLRQQCSSCVVVTNPQNSFFLCKIIRLFISWIIECSFVGRQTKREQTFDLVEALFCRKKARCILENIFILPLKRFCSFKKSFKFCFRLARYNRQLVCLTIFWS